MVPAGVIIVAAGASRRLGGNRPKQFRKLRGRPLVSYSLDVFQQVPQVHWMVLVVPAKSVIWARSLFYGSHRYDKVVAVVAGGITRQDSVTRGLAALPPQAKNVLVHDGVRPFISISLVRQLIQALSDRAAVVPACPIADTIKRLSRKGDVVVKTIARNGLFAVQTPQAFRRSLLQQALNHAQARQITGTDEAMLVEQLGRRVAVIAGDPLNIKITYPHDWSAAQNQTTLRGSV